MSCFFNESVKIGVICDALNINCEIDQSIELTSISDSDSAKEYSICDYIKGKIPGNVEGLILLVKDEIPGYTCIIVQNPQEVLIDIINYIIASVGFYEKYIKSIIPNSVIFGQNVVIEKNVKIGEGTIIEHNVVIHSGTKIGKNCLIRTNTSIGGGGYGYVKKTDGSLIKSLHLGGVELSDDVEVGANCCIVRGIVNDTYIAQGVKIDNLVHIAHDCYIDEGAFIIACSELSGYVRVGKRSRIAPNACVKQRVVIGDDVLVGMGAVVLKDIPDSTTVVGNPAKKLRQFN